MWNCSHLGSEELSSSPVTFPALQEWGKGLLKTLFPKQNCSLTPFLLLLKGLPPKYSCPGPKLGVLVGAPTGLQWLRAFPSPSTGHLKV